MTTYDFSTAAWGVLPVGTQRYSVDFATAISADFDVSNVGGIVIANDGNPSFFNEDSLKLPAGTSGRIILKNSVFSQADMVAYFRGYTANATQRRRYLGLGVRCQNNGDGYWISNDNTSNSFLTLIKRVSGVNTVIAGGGLVDSAVFPANTMFSLVGICKGTQIVFLVYADSDFTDCIKAISVVDGAITAAGSVGIGGFANASVDEWADDLVVYDYQQISNSTWSRNVESVMMGLAPSSRYGSVFSGDGIIFHPWATGRDWTKSGVVNAKNLVVTARFSENQSTTRPWHSVGLRIDPATGDGYWGGIEINTDIGVGIYKRVSGVFTLLAQDINNGSLTLDTEYAMEFSADENYLMIRHLNASGLVHANTGPQFVGVVDTTFASAGEIGIGRRHTSAPGAGVTFIKDIEVTGIVDTTAPAFSGGVSGLAVADLATNGDFTVSCNAATDAGSGVRGYKYYFKAGDNSPFAAPDFTKEFTVNTAMKVRNQPVAPNAIVSVGVHAVDNDGNETANTDYLTVTPTVGSETVDFGPFEVSIVDDVYTVELLED